MNTFLLLILFWASSSERIFEEKDGIVSVEAEHFSREVLNETRGWHIIKEGYVSETHDDPDSQHTVNASNNCYLEILPDTRTNHSEKLIHGENFSNQPGKLGVLSYPVYFHHPGKYYVWVRAYSTGSEDNGIHVGLNGEWPASGQRMQWCEGKHQWTWESKQRTKENHCGVPKLIYLEILESGLHTINFSMREDGFEFDKWVMTQEYIRPDGQGPEETIRRN